MMGCHQNRGTESVPIALQQLPLCLTLDVTRNKYRPITRFYMQYTGLVIFFAGEIDSQRMQDLKLHPIPLPGLALRTGFALTVVQQPAGTGIKLFDRYLGQQTVYPSDMIIITMTDDQHIQAADPPGA